MTFHSKIDGYYKICMLMLFLLVLGTLVLPVIFDTEANKTDLIIGISIPVILIACILWYTFSVKYIITDKYLIVKGAFFRSRILYKDILFVSHINKILDTLIGYRLMTAKKGLEIAYKTGLIGSVKISPADEEVFLSELQKRCPNLEIRES